MMSDRQFEERTRTPLSLSDLKQIKEAVRELRASSPKSILADLVEEKIRALENDDLAPRRDASLARGRWTIN